eukprot:TRINITY_DN15467_c0_g1_i1.p1 TRINITY_DN15467_c0_g1~~TRINITY_DN15467_c0_g1_i1.p1  ORF type:complete len:149 (+),score=14.10 TRINITY_DN15467_c0_g1_i1:17-463(+)
MDALSALQTIGHYTSGIFAGAALYISMVQQPSLAQTLSNNELPVHFKSFYPKAARMQAMLTVVSSAALIANHFMKHNWWNLAAGLLMGSIFPYTVLLMLPVNNQFMNATPESTPTQPFTKLFSTWGKLHWYRTIASVIAFGIMTWKKY